MAAVLLGKEASDDDDATLITDSGTSLTDRVDGSSRLALSLVGMEASLWLRMAASEWTVGADFLQYRDFARSVKVTNDVAERGIAMVQALTHTTKDDKAQLVVAARGEGGAVEGR